MGIALRGAVLRLIRTSGRGNEAEVEIEGQRLRVLDALSPSDAALAPGELDEAALEVVTIGENGVGEDDILVHDETSRPLASMLAAMQPPALPVAMGILLRLSTPAYEASVHAQIEELTKANPPTNLNDVLRKGPIWTTGV